MHRHFIIHKPCGFLSQFISLTKKQLPMLGSLHDFPQGTMAIGRLDAQSEGMLFLTTDGKVSELIRSKKVEKEYFVQVDGIADSSTIEKLKSGVEISHESIKYLTKPCEARLLDPQPIFPPRSKRIRDDRHGPTSWISITLREGKYRQVRKMTAVVGLPTLRLMRVRIGQHHLGSMESGAVLEVPQFEI